MNTVLVYDLFFHISPFTVLLKFDAVQRGYFQSVVKLPQNRLSLIHIVILRSPSEKSGIIKWASLKQDTILHIFSR